MKTIKRQTAVWLLDRRSTSVGAGLAYGLHYCTPAVCDTHKTSLQLRYMRLVALYKPWYASAFDWTVPLFWNLETRRSRFKTYEHNRTDMWVWPPRLNRWEAIPSIVIPIKKVSRPSISRAKPIRPTGRRWPSILLPSARHQSKLQLKTMNTGPACRTVYLLTTDVINAQSKIKTTLTT